MGVAWVITYMCGLGYCIHMWPGLLVICVWPGLLRMGVAWVIIYGL